MVESELSSVNITRIITELATASIAKHCTALRATIYSLQMGGELH